MAQQASSQTAPPQAIPAIGFKTQGQPSEAEKARQAKLKGYQATPAADAASSSWSCLARCLKCGLWDDLWLFLIGMSHWPGKLQGGIHFRQYKFIHDENFIADHAFIFDFCAARDVWVDRGEGTPLFCSRE